MSDEANTPSPLEQRLDEAGRACQPRDPGWETLAARLTPRQAPVERSEPSRTPALRRRRSWLALAAALLVVLGVYRLIGPNGDNQARALNLAVEVQRRGVQVTVFNASENDEPTLYQPLAKAFGGDPGGPAGGPQQMLFPNPGPVQTAVNVVDAPEGGKFQGLALVKDQRMVLHLATGDNLVKFTDVAAAIDPTSVKLVSDTDPVGTQVVEQNFEFDLASADALLKRYVDRAVACVGRKGELLEGFLVSFDPQEMVLADRPPAADPKQPRPKVQTVSRRKLQSIRCAEMPADLHTRPTLVWKLRTSRPGDHAMTLTYLCGHMQWQADYVAVIRPAQDGGDLLDIKGWVSVDNRSGATYERAGIKLIAGEVNRVRDPWAPPPPQPTIYLLGAFEYAPGPTGGRETPKELVQRDFFEYKLYALNLPSTVKDRQIKQLNLLEVSGVKARRRMLCDDNPEAIPPPDQPKSNHPLVQLLIKNDKANRLGQPLPKGRMTLVAEDADGDAHIVGRQQIEHTPKDEVLTLNMGRAFDMTFEVKVLDHRQPAVNHIVDTYEIRVRNHRDSAADVRAVGWLLPGMNWKVTATTDRYVQHDFQTLHFDFTLPANQEKMINYTVHYEAAGGDGRIAP